MYDVDGNGWIDLVEMTKIGRSIYKMTGPNSDGRVTQQEFVRSCLNDSKLAEMLSPRWIIITNKTIISQLASFSGCDVNIPDICNLQLIIEWVITVFPIIYCQLLKSAVIQAVKICFEC